MAVGCPTFDPSEKAEEVRSWARRSKRKVSPAAPHHDSGRHDVPHAAGNMATQRLLRSGAIQAKLTVNAPGDVYEQEADHIADRVMHRSEPKLQRACACGGECPKCQKEQRAQGHAQLKAVHVGSNAPGRTAVPPIVHETLRSPGQPLDTTTHAFFEPRLGWDLSRVRIHTDAQAAQSARTISARAYTLGNEIVFGAGEYRPTTPQG